MIMVLKLEEVYINNLCYAENIILIDKNAKGLQTLVIKVKKHSGKMGLK